MNSIILHQRRRITLVDTKSQTRRITNKSEIKIGISSKDLKRQFNFSNKSVDFSDSSLKDLITQAPEPGTRSKASMPIVGRDMHAVLDKPVANNLTNGYLPPKMLRDVGK